MRLNWQVMLQLLVLGVNLKNRFEVAKQLANSSVQPTKRFVCVTINQSIGTLQRTVGDASDAISSE